MLTVGGFTNVFANIAVAFFRGRYNSSLAQVHNPCP
jgi:hypothetical protein